MRKVSPGEPVRFQAETFNTMIDAAAEFRRRQFQFVPPSVKRADFGILPVRNETGDAIGRFAVLVLAGILIDPADNEPEFLADPAFSGIAPATGALEPWVLTLQPALEDDIVPAMIAGITPAQINVTDEAHEFAQAADGMVEMLSSGNAGPARILWKEAGTGIKWAVLQFPFGGAGVARKYARITSHLGTAPPFIYSATEVDYTGDFGDYPDGFSAVSGGDDLSQNMVNLQEANEGGESRAPVPNNSVVAYMPMANFFAFWFSTNAGLYP